MLRTHPTLLTPFWANHLLRLPPLLAGLLLFVLLAQATTAQHSSPTPDGTPMAERFNHWAWQPLRTVTPPAAGHPVDGFVAAKLRAVELQPAPLAKPHEQLRRLWFDLVGLPPTPAAIQRFGEQATDADYLREVDELLASPQFGERWARHWLDLMRYCETLGHEFDFEIPNAWRYRDYVIRALNQDLPYDQFVREHIAGDLLAKPRRDKDGNNESVQATASWWFVEQTHSPVDSMQHQADRVDNQIDVFGKAFLGMTVACARCHDHKFDAIPTRDYYSLFGFVQSSRYVQASLKEVPPESNAYQTALTRQRELSSLWLPDAMPIASGVTFRDEDVVIADANDHNHAGDSSQWFVSNDAFGNEPWRGPFCANPNDDKPQLRQLPGAFWLSAAAGTQREGTIATATFPLDQRYVHVRVAGDHSRIKLIVDGFHITRNPIYGDLHRNIDNQEAHWITFDVNMWLGHQAHLQAIDQRAPDLGDPRHNRGRYPDHCWIALQSVSNSPHGSPPETTSVPLVAEADAARTKKEWRNARQLLSDAVAALAVSPTIPAMADGSGIDTHVYLRGDHKQPGETAPRRFLSALDAAAKSAPKETSGRLELANSVLAKGNPMPTRVLVNRLWHHLFGRGLVKSVDNFGALGEPASHPDLLDWLANDFAANGWSIKHSIRRIVTSHTYRQRSQLRPEATASDANNKLLHRQNVRPLEAEVLRDTLLAISGRLDKKLYGQSIEQPKEAVTNARGKPGRHDPRDGHGRRSIYLAMRRNFMPDMLLAFDLPTPFATVGRRNTSNVPAQSLALANAPLVHDLSELFAKRVIAHSADYTERLQLAYLLAFARKPRANELEPLLAFVGQNPDAKGDEEVRTWTDAVHALINTTEFRFRR
ncbi:MAG: cytochrome c553 [Planctomycetota bacterium]|jgi:cytochrome c553